MTAQEAVNKIAAYLQCEDMTEYDKTEAKLEFFKDRHLKMVQRKRSIIHTG